MADPVDKIGVVRAHRWITVAEQRRQLEAEGCRGIVELSEKMDGAKQSDLIKMSTAGRTFVFVHAFLLVDPKYKKRRGGLQANFDDVVAKIGARGAAVKDLETGLTTTDKRHRKAIAAVAHSHIARSNQGLRSALNGARSKGRPATKFTAEQLKDAKSVWRNLKDYPTWEAAEAAFPEGFTAARAFRMWHGRR